MEKHLTWLDSIPANDSKHDMLSSDLFTDAIYYFDLETDSDLFTKKTTNLTTKSD